MPDIRSTKILDDCQRADESPLSNGGRWRPVSGGQANWNAYEPGLMLHSHAIHHFDPTSSPSATSVSYWAKDVFRNRVECWGIAGAGFDLSEGWRLFLNLKGVETYPTMTGYELMLNAAVGPDYWQISKFSPGKSQLAITAVSTPMLGTNEICLFRYEDGELSAWRDNNTGGASWTNVLNASDSSFPYGYIGLGIDQDDNNPSWKGFGGGRIYRTQIYRRLTN